MRAKKKESTTAVVVANIFLCIAKTGPLSAHWPYRLLSTSGHHYAATRFLSGPLALCSSPPKPNPITGISFHCVGDFCSYSYSRLALYFVGKETGIEWRCEFCFQLYVNGQLKWIYYHQNIIRFLQHTHTLDNCNSCIEC